MSLSRIRETFFRLPRHIKLIGIGSIVLAISTLLPWYADLDSYRVGDEFLGVTGPASFVGIVILLISGVSLWIFSYHLLERRVPRLPVREGILHLFVAVESLFLLVLVNSIFFHPKFGVNITLKESRFGMTLAFVGSIILLVGGYSYNREQIAKVDETGKLEPLIKMPEETMSRPVATVRPAQQTPTPPPARVTPAQFLRPHTPISQRKNFMFGEPKPEAVQTEEPKKDDKSDGGSYMIRMDL